MIRHKTLFNYARFRYLKLSALLAGLATLTYVVHDPPLNSYSGYGGTLVGNALGGIAALLIVWLAVYGMRKRAYRTPIGTVQGWLSAHVYFGIALVVVATLHTGFEFGWNVHTLAYALMWLVVASGIYGVVLYARVPSAMTHNMGEQTLTQALADLDAMDRDLGERALSLPDDVLRLVTSSIEKTRLGGSAWRLLRGHEPKCPTALAVAQLPTLTRHLHGDAAQRNHAVYSLLVTKQERLAQLRRHLRYRALLDAWLYVHVPITFALLAALGAHILAVLLYR
jgi:hypothetical protein